MNLSQLRYVKAVAETGSFTLAAERCYVTQPTLSNGIAQLEQELLVYEWHAANSIWFQTEYDQPIFHLSGRADDANRIVGALAELGYTMSDQAVGHILKCRNVPTAPELKKTTSWKEFISSYMEVLWVTDFFATEVWTMDGLGTYYELFFYILGKSTDSYWRRYGSSG